MGLIMHRMKVMASKCADCIKTMSVVRVISHIDADGLTSAAIMSTALERAGIDHSIDFVRQLTNEILEKIAASTSDPVIFLDLGSGMLDKIKNLELKLLYLTTMYHRVIFRFILIRGYMGLMALMN